jgi:LacI family transcriptional regulator, galactose operon repressor
MTDARSIPLSSLTGRSATMRDVAAVAGVSLKTVSRVVNQEPVVDPRTAERVERAIEELHYRRNGLARNLRKGIRQLTVGLVIEDLSNPFYGTLAQAVEDVADRNQHAVIVISSREDSSRERRLVSELVRRGVDGVLVVPASRDHRYMEPDIRRGVRFVFLDRSPRGIDVDTVLIDNRAGARRGVEHLIKHGHRRIAFVADPLANETSEERFRGYRDALASAGIAVDQDLVRTGSLSVESAEASMHALLELPQPPSAVFTQNNRNSVGVIRAIGAARASIALVGFDDFDLATMLPVPVTVVANDPDEMGRRGAEMLFERLGGESGPSRRVFIGTRLIPRGSGEIRPAGVKTGNGP